MGKELNRAVSRLVIAQSGVVRREQIYELGMPARTLSRRVEQGHWQAVSKRVLVLAGTAPGLITDSLVVAHSVFPAGMLTGWSALALRGQLYDDPWTVVDHDPRPWLRVNQHRRVPARLIRESSPTPKSSLLAGVLVADRDTVIIDLLRFLDPADARTLLFRLAHHLGPAPLERLIASALVDLQNGKAAAQLRELLPLLAVGARSQAEELLLKLLREAGYSGFRPNHPVWIRGHRYQIDVAFPEQMLAIEVDGRAYHSSHARFESDRDRQNGLIVAGWRVLRFTWTQLTRHPEAVLAEISRMLSS